MSRARRRRDMRRDERSDCGMVGAMTIDAQLATLAAAGFDIAHAFDARAAAREPGWALLAGDERLGILIGNTRSLWPLFTAAMRDPALASRAHPLDHYTERILATAFPDARVYFSHRRYARDARLGDASEQVTSEAERFLPFQQLAVATGLGALSEGGLVIHPVYGPWLALRAVVRLDGQPVARAPIAKPCVCDARCATALAAARAGDPDRDREWEAWLAVRDSCTLRDHRYPDDQIRYHYTKRWEPPPYR